MLNSGLCSSPFFRCGSQNDGKKELTCNALANGVVRSGSNTSSSLKRSAQILARPLPATVLFAENPSGRRQRREFTATDAQQCCGGAVKVGASVQFLLSVSIVCCGFVVPFVLYARPPKKEATNFIRKCARNCIDLARTSRVTTSSRMHGYCFISLRI
jgi:hypothetical protein